MYDYPEKPETVPSQEYDDLFEHMETVGYESDQFRQWLDNVRSNMCACGSHHIDPEEHVGHCPYRRVVGGG